MADAPASKDKTIRMSYHIARCEMGVMTFEPYKSFLLPMWRFRTSFIAKTSAEALYNQFLAYNDADDFVGMDMCRKFIQMGMTRAKRYANYKGGKKYTRHHEWKVPNNKSDGHKGMADKEQSSCIFKEVWERCKRHEGYQKKKVKFLDEQKQWSTEQDCQGNTNQSSH